MPSAPSPAGYCATSATGSSCRPATPPRLRAPSGAFVTTPAYCAPRRPGREDVRAHTAEAWAAGTRALEAAYERTEA